jgi:2-polyprenyl-3-methyl-5-hydroxy-6-metoxy-1,4-benzoquinol methylase
MLDKLISNFTPLDIEKLRTDNFYDNFFNSKKIDTVRIEKGNGWEKCERCPICGSRKQETEFSYLNINIVRCPDCSHRYTDKVPVNLSEVYNSEEYSEALEKLELQQKDYRANRFGKERAEIAVQLFENTDKTVLDVGCGWGYFLSHLKNKGFDCHGIELSKQVADLAKKQYGLDISYIPIEEYDSGIEFDLITLFGVIEHIKDPINFLKHCKRLLKKTGFILIFTPNFESIAVRIMRENANMIYPGQHLHHFTWGSINKAAARLKMSIYSYSTNGIDIGDICSYYKYLNQNEVASFLLENAAMLQSVIDISNCANHMRVILQKNRLL